MKLYVSNCRQIEWNTSFPFCANVENVSDLLRVAQFDHMASCMKNHYRDSGNFLHSDVVIADLDNTHTDEENEWFDIKDICECFDDVRFYYIESRNHMKAKRKTNKKGVVTKIEAPRPKYHIYFPLSATVEDPKQYSKIINTAVALFPYFDFQAKAIANQFYGVEDPKGAFVRGALTLDQYLPL